MKKYKQNLRVENTTEGQNGDALVISYKTVVARIEGKELIQLGYYSQTTQKHINYVASELKLRLTKPHAGKILWINHLKDELLVKFRDAQIQWHSTGIRPAKIDKIHAEILRLDPYFKASQLYKNL